MKFDVIIIGGGLSGLSCGISLAARGLRTALVSAGQSSLYFNTGNFDLLGYDSAGKPVEEPLKAMSEVPAYRKISDPAGLAARAKALLEDAGLELEGSAGRNRWRTTALGVRRPCWLMLKGADGASIPWDQSGPGLFIHNALVKRYRALGGLVLTGDTAMDGKIEKGALAGCCRVTGLSTEKLGPGAICAERYVLCSGSFMNRGLAAEAERIYEPVFAVDLLCSTPRINMEVFAAQPYMEFGVVTDHSFRALKDAQLVENLWAAGQILAGNNLIKYCNAEGVQMLTALQVADNILKETEK